MTTIFEADTSKILIVEDDVAIYVDLEARLKKLGYEVRGVVNNRERALAAVAAEPPDLVLMNFVLAGEIGAIQAAEIIKNKLGIPVVFLGDAGGLDEIECAKRAYPFGCIHKPYLDRDIEIAVEMAFHAAGIEAERRRAERVFKDSEARFRHLIEGSQDLIYRMSLPDGLYEYISPAAMTISGYAPGEFYKEPRLIQKCIHPDSREYLDREWTNLLNGQVPPHYEFKIIHKSGAVKWVHQRNAMVWDDHGQPVAIEGIVTDVTALKQTQQALKESQELFRLFMEHFSGHAFIKDLPGRYVYSNAESRHQAVRDGLGLIGRTDAEIYPSEIAEQYVKYDHRVLSEKKALEVVESGLHNGGRKMYATTKFPIYESGEIAYVGGISIDISHSWKAEKELRKSEERLALALEGADLGYWDWDVQAGTISVSRRWARMLGYEQEEVEGDVLVWRSLIHPEDLPMVEEMVEGHLDGRLDAYEAEHRIRHKSGHWIWILNKGKVIERDPEGRALRACGTHLNITERKKAEDDQRILIQMLDDAPSLIAVHDMEKGFIYVNRRTYEAHGYTYDEFMSMNLRDLDASKDGEPMDSRVARLEEVGELSFEVVHRRKDGSLMPLNVHTRLANWGGSTVVLSVAEDITERKQVEAVVRESQKIVRKKLKAILEPDGDIGTLELGEIIDTKIVKSIMEDFCDYSKIGTSVIDLQGKVLVGVGWTDICAKFHRAHPETGRHCLESDTQAGLAAGGEEPRLYKCKNNIWDMSIPIVVGGRHVGNLFAGQFFFEDEKIDYDQFRAQARRCGFNEPAYMAALEKVPRWPRDTVRSAMKLVANFASVVSKLSFGNIRLARMFNENNSLLKALRDSEEHHRVLVESSAGAIFVAQDGLLKFVNPRTEEISGYSREELLATPYLEIVHPDERKMFLDRLHMRRRGEEPSPTFSFRFNHKTGRLVWVELKLVVIEWGGRPATLNFMDDITQRKQVELELEVARRELEERVEQRTRELVDLNNRLVSEIDERKRIEAELISHQSRLNRLASDLLLTEERERRSLATVLHDEIGQQLALSKIQLKTLINTHSGSPLSEQLDNICDSINSMIGTTRSLTTELSPPVLYELGLKEAIEWLADLMENTYAISTQVKHDQALPELEDDMNILLFRAVRELLVNVVKHAQARQIDIHLNADAEFAQISVADDGVGFHDNITAERLHLTGGYGLLNIRERLASLGGWMVIGSQGGRGSCVTMVVPRKENS